MSGATVQVDEGLRRVLAAAEENAAATGRWLEKLAVLRERDRAALIALTAAHGALTACSPESGGWSS
ncbi:hypothetical protein ACIRBX_06600 [Kitasatospora sp. NPDC096147]|uniref:hypothetical protein n=1 Tax=Kitasatospora sp. NPDC096147 TaxID=3364093 RepID=UPI0038141F8A